MAQLTTAVGDEEVIKHFREVLAPYVMETQLVGGLDNSISPTSNQSTTGGGEGRRKFLSSQDFIDKLTDILGEIIQGLTKKELSGVITLRNTELADGEEAVIALRLGTFQALCSKRGMKTMAEKEIRDNIEKFNLGKRSGQHKFYSPRKEKFSTKGCVFLKRDLFPPGLIAAIENDYNDGEDEIKDGNEQQCIQENRPSNEIQALKETMAQMQRTINRLKSRKRELKRMLPGGSWQESSSEEEREAAVSSTTEEGTAEQREKEGKDSEPKTKRRLFDVTSKDNTTGEIVEKARKEEKEGQQEKEKQEGYKVGKQTGTEEYEQKEGKAGKIKNQTKDKGKTGNKEQEEHDGKMQRQEEDTNDEENREKNVDLKEKSQKKQHLKDLEQVEIRLDCELEKEDNTEGDSSDGSAEIPFITEPSKGRKPGVPFVIAVEEKLPQRKKKVKKATKRTTKKNVCDVCGTKTKSGHVKCSVCGQWKHIKCTGITIREAETKGYKCPHCS